MFLFDKTILSEKHEYKGSNFRIFWLIFFKLCIGINIEEEWFGIANGQILFRTIELWPLVYVNNVFSPVSSE